MKIDLFFPTLDGPSNEEVAAAQKIIDARDAAIEKQKSSALIGCPSCKDLLHIANLVYIQTYWYREPFGCSDGDYWNLGEGRTKCVKCDEELRFNYSPEVTKLKKYFKRTQNSHQR